VIRTQTTYAIHMNTNVVTTQASISP
jgi:hypothetical protein